MRQTKTFGLAAIGLAGLVAASPAIGATRTTKRATKTTKAAPTTKAPATTAAAVTTAAPSTTNASDLSIAAAGAAAANCPANRKGGQATVGESAPLIYGLSPYTTLGSGAVGGNYMSMIYDTLMRYDPKTQTFSPNLAESLKPNANFSEWTLKLKPNIKFGNGDTMTVEDVQANIQNFQRSRVRGAGMATEVKSMRIVDPLTMVFNVGDPWGMFPYMLASEPGWVPNRKVFAERQGATPITTVAGFALNPAGAGAGPYEFVSYKDNEEIVLKAKASYFRGSACIETLRFKYVPGADAQYEAFLKKELDALFINNVRIAAKARETNNLDFGAPVGVNYVTMDQGITGAKPAPFADIRIREAMQLAINYDVINQRLFDNKTPLTDSAVVPKESPMYHGVAGPPYDLARARTLVAQTITDGTWDGSFTWIHDPTPQAVDQALVLKALWEAAGMRVILEPVPSVGTRIIAERRFQAGGNGFNIMDPFPWGSVNGFICNSPRQRTGYCNPQMDAAMARLKAADSLEETKKGLAEMQNVWNKTFPAIMIGHTIWGFAVQTPIKGATYGPDNTIYMDTAYIQK